MTTIVHCKKQPYDVYIGRTQEKFHFGNPFTYQDRTLALVKVKDRYESVAAFQDWLTGLSYFDIDPERRAWILANLYRLKDKVLGCWCAPLECHGDIYCKILNLNK